MAPVTFPLNLFRSLAGQSVAKTKAFKVLRNITASFRPGTMTLVLAAPGHGKSAFLKAVAGRLSGTELTGTITYSGKTAAELQASGIAVSRIAAFVGQSDNHISKLSVSETVSFAW